METIILDNIPKLDRKIRHRYELINQILDRVTEVTGFRPGEPYWDLDPALPVKLGWQFELQCWAKTWGIELENYEILDSLRWAELATYRQINALNNIIKMVDAVEGKVNEKIHLSLAISGESINDLVNTVIKSEHEITTPPLSPNLEKIFKPFDVNRSYEARKEDRINQANNVVYYYVIMTKKRRSRYISRGSKYVALTRKDNTINLVCGSFSSTFAKIGTNYNVKVVSSKGKYTIIASNIPLHNMRLTNEVGQFNKFIFVPINNLGNPNRIGNAKNLLYLPLHTNGGI
jgi:hypothetical protein